MSAASFVFAMLSAFLKKKEKALAIATSCANATIQTVLKKALKHKYIKKKSLVSVELLSKLT